MTTTAAPHPRLELHPLDTVDVAWSTVPVRVGPVRVGDTIVFAGASHIVVALDRTNGFGDVIADCAGGWSIATDDGAVVPPTPNARWCTLATGGLS